MVLDCLNHQKVDLYTGRLSARFPTVRQYACSTQLPQGHYKKAAVEPYITIQFKLYIACGVIYLYVLYVTIMRFIAYKVLVKYDEMVGFY